MKGRPKDLYRGFGKWLEKFLWARQKRGIAYEAMRVSATALWKFDHDKGPLRASALAFSTALGLVPLLALVFAFLKGVGAEGKVVRLLIDQFAVGNTQIADKLTEYVGRLKVSTLGVAGFSSFMFSALFVMHNIEHCFNDIWGVARGRTFLRKLTDYSAILVVCPLLLLFSTSMLTTAEVSSSFVTIDFVEKALPLLFSLAPYFAKAVAFGVAYLVVPNARVGFKAALVGGLISAFFWQMAEYGYIRFGIVMAKNNSIYGALAQLPVFLLWIYTGWCIVILGAQLACVMELPGRGRFLKGGSELWSPRPSVALEILMDVARRYALGVPAIEEVILDEMGFHPVEGKRIVGELVLAGLLVRAADEAGSLMPARNPENVPMGELLAAVTLYLEEGKTLGRVEKEYLADVTRCYGAESWAAWARKVS